MSNDEHNCPVCGKAVFSQEACYEICEICGWEDDPIQKKDPNYAGGANKISLNESKIIYERKTSQRILE